MNKNIELPINLCSDIEETIKECYSCGKCTSGCPVAYQMEYPPSVLVKLISLGKIEKVIQSKTIWVCSSCQTCVSRCPFQINIPDIIDLLKEYAYKNGITGKEKNIRLFHKIFLSEVRRLGRINEASFIGKWKIASGNLFSDISLGINMLLKGKLPLFPEKIKQRREIAKWFRKNE